MNSTRMARPLVSLNTIHRRIRRPGCHEAAGGSGSGSETAKYWAAVQLPHAHGRVAPGAPQRRIPHGCDARGC